MSCNCAGEPSLTCLIFAALEGEPVQVALLRESDDFLRSAVGGRPEVLESARHLGFKAFEFALFGSDEALDHLRAAAKSFSMITRLYNAL